MGHIKSLTDAEFPECQHVLGGGIGFAQPPVRNGRLADPQLHGAPEDGPSALEDLFEVGKQSGQPATALCESPAGRASIVRTALPIE
jgi:hypothetical protein